MKKNTLLKFLFLSLVLSSCGLIERFKTPEQPTDTVSNSETKPAEGDDLFAQTASDSTAPKDESKTDIDDLFGDSMNDTAKTSGSDAPSNIGSEEPPMITESKEAPMIVEESIPEIKTEVAEATSLEGGTMQTYKVQKGETLMQIAFKLYGDIGKWKDIKAMNKDKISNNSSLRANMNLKYMAPESPFVWNPSGVPYMIKNGDTLGIISSNVYSTPKKWKAIYENNKPLIKNPNVIFAGFTLYYKKDPTMANYVQPAAAQPVVTKAATKSITQSEDVMIEKLIQENSREEKTIEGIQENAAIENAPTENQIDEAIQQQSAPVRGSQELDLINNVSQPLNEDEAVQGTNMKDSLPVIDEEIQNLE